MKQTAKKEKKIPEKKMQPYKFQFFFLARESQVLFLHVIMARRKRACGFKQVAIVAGKHSDQTLSALSL